MSNPSPPLSHALSPYHGPRSSGPMVNVAMDDFLLKAYLPQLQEKAAELVLYSVNGRYRPHPYLEWVRSD